MLLAGMARLRLFERVARHATSLRLFAAAGDGSTGWQLDVPGARLTLVLSPEVWRGFSGRGSKVLHRLALAAPPAGSRCRSWCARGGKRGWCGEALGATTGRPRDEVSGALAALALSGLVGYDLGEGGFFRRELPSISVGWSACSHDFAPPGGWSSGGAVRIESADATGVDAWVTGGGRVEYRVRSGVDGWTCMCPWYGRRRGDRGPASTCSRSSWWRSMSPG